MIMLNHNDDITDSIFDLFDELFEHGNFAAADKILIEIDLSDKSIQYIVDVLCATLTGKQMLKYRGLFVNRCKEALDKLDPHRRDDLMQGLW